MMRYYKLIFFCVMMLLLVPLFAFAAEPVGILTLVEGGVDVLKAGETFAAPVFAGGPVYMGDIVRTKKEGKAEIQFKDETVVRLAPETRLKIDEYTYRAGGNRESGMLSLLRGKIRAIVSKIKAGVMPVAAGASNFNIKTPTAIAGVKGTDFFVYYTRGITGVIFKEGSGFVYNPALPTKIIRISAGQATYVSHPNAAPMPPRRVTEADMAPHVRDTTVSEKPKSDEGKPGETKPVTQEAGVDQRRDQGKSTEAADTAGRTAPKIDVMPPAEPPIEFPEVTFQDRGGNTVTPPAETQPPITETKKELLITPVTVNVTFPK